MAHNEISRRDLIAGGAAAAMLTSGIVPAHAQSAEELSILVGFAPGGGTDRSARVIAPDWATKSGITSPVGYEYAEGAGGIVAIQRMLSASPRAKKVLANITVLQYIAWNVLLKEGNYERKDISFFGSYFEDPDVVLVKKDSPFNSIAELIEDARKNEKTVGVTAAMSPSHAAMVVLREETGAKLRAVPFNGGSAARNAVAGGHVDICIASYWSALHVLDLTKALAIFADENPAPMMWNPEPINKALKIDFPHLIEPYAFMESGKSAEANPERHKMMADALKTALDQPSVRAAAEKNQRLDLFLKYRSPEECVAYLDDYLSVLGKYRPSMQKDLDSL